MTIRTASEIESERKAFKADRYGHNNSLSAAEPPWGRITYLAHAKGYVMARRPGCTPFVLSEEMWKSFNLWAAVNGEHGSGGEK